MRNMPPLAAAATECRILGTARIKHGTSPTKTCSVRIHGELAVSYLLRRVGGGPITILHSEAPRRFEQRFDLHDPDAFFGSYTACRDAVHGMLARTPLLRELDLGADNWDGFFTPGVVATTIVNGFRRDMDKHGGVALGISLGLRWAVTARVVYSEPMALLLACIQPPRIRFVTSGCGRYMRRVPAAVAAEEFMPAMAVPPAECCVCMEDLAAQHAAYTVRLPCSHCFHRGCILPWFYKAATCPMCRRDTGKYLVAATGTPMGKFPGLRGQTLTDAMSFEKMQGGLEDEWKRCNVA